MTTGDRPLIEMRGVTKDHGGSHPLRVRSLSVRDDHRLVLSGLDAAAAETFFHLISGAAVPDEGSVLVAGVDTRTIATDTEWLVSLDRFGFMTHRAVLLESLDVAANLALPMTLEVDPMPAPVLRQVQVLADDVGLARERLSEAVGRLDPLARARLHLARALAVRPRLLLLEHPTEGLRGDDERQALGRSLRHVGEHHGMGWIALSDDAVFARASGGRHQRLLPSTGRIVGARGFWPWNRN